MLDESPPQQQQHRESSRRQQQSSRKQRPETLETTVGEGRLVHHLAIALGHKAVEAGHRVLFLTVDE